ncbi:MAG TPA: VOC family protein [Verrucomicrobiae bacterium]|jgi:catechol 2,3-dioxygenase-like lactoylglutathione lyase family enzyme|nr:VOC family protein [Verrucomicrobiae bacterium]
MSILSLDHVQIAIPVGGEEAARSFYVGILGFNEQQKPAALAGRNSIWFIAGPVNLHLGVEADADFHAARRAHPAFTVDNLDEIVAACERAGLPTRTDTPIGNFRRTHVFDPFGNRIELMESTTP